jgi:hypothetical protein
LRHDVGSGCPSCSRGLRRGRCREPCRAVVARSVVAAHRSRGRTPNHARRAWRSDRAGPGRGSFRCRYSKRHRSM